MTDAGVLVSMVRQIEPPTENDFLTMISNLSANYSIDYKGEPGNLPTPNQLKVRLLIKRIQTNRWTARQLRERLATFLDDPNYKFPTWKIAEFLDAGFPRIYPNSWRLTRLKENRNIAPKIGAFWITDDRDSTTGYVVYGWLDEIRNLLPRYEPRAMPLLAAAPSPVTDQSELLADLRKSLQPIEQLEEQIKLLQQAIEDRDQRLETLQDAVKLEERILALQAEIQALQQRNRKLENDRAEIYALLHWQGDKGEQAIQWEALLERIYNDNPRN